MCNRWDEPVIVRTSKCQVKVVRTAAEAYGVMTTSWPVTEGCALIVALEVCSGARNDFRDQKLARRVFLNAVQEAGLLLATLPSDRWPDFTSSLH
jgi:hypothetical protein